MKTANQHRSYPQAMRARDRRFPFASVLACLLVVGLCVIGASKVVAQTASTGALSGVVTDPKGGSIAGATLKAINDATGETRSVTTESNGTFVVPLLLPGSYRLEVAASGFKSLVRTGIHVLVTETGVVNVQLAIGMASEVVRVNAETELFDTESATLGNVTNGQMVRDLPLVNRNYTQIIGLSPGVNADVTNASDLGRGNSGLNASTGGFSSHGGATNDNNYQMNGAQVNDLMAAGSFSGGVPIPNPDSIQEFKVQTGQYDASYGRNAGANVNVVTKSGTNDFHGTVFEFVRNDIFNANNFFLNRAGVPRGSLKQNQFGGTLGGPIVKDKLFFFGSYQGTRQVNGLDSSAACLSTYTTPTQLAGLGSDRSREALGAAFAGQQSPLTGQTIAADGSNLSQQTVNLLNLTLANGNFLIPPPQNTTTGQSSVTQNCTFNDDQFLVGVDLVSSDRSRLTGRFFFDNGNQLATFPAAFAPALPGFGQPIDTSFRNLSVTHTYTFSPSLVNQFVFGFNHLKNVLQQQEPLVKAPGGSGLVPFSYSLIGVTAPPNDDEFPGIGILGQFALGGNGQGATIIQDNYNVDDSLTYVRGRQTIRFGAGVSPQQINFPEFHFLGISAFLDTPDFLLGNVAVSEDFVGQPERQWRAFNADAYAQDDIRLFPHFTLSLGLRYERQGAIGDSLGRSSIFNIALADPTAPLPEGSLQGYTVASNYTGAMPTGVIRAGNIAAINEDGQNDWGPRVGFSWQLPRSQRFVLRGGYGIYYTRTTGQPFLQLLASAPYGAIRTKQLPPIIPFDNPFPAGTPVFPFFPAYSAATALTPVTFSANFRPPILQNYSLNLQTELSKNLVLEIGYQGGRGTHLLQLREFNQALSASPSDPIRGQTENLLANIAQRVPIQGFLPAGATLIESAGASWYNGLNVSLNKRFSHGLQLLASYTWARSLTADNGYSTGVNGGQLSGNQIDPASRYGPDGFIRPQRLIISYVYELPGTKDKFSLPGRFLNGWSVSGVTTFQAGQYLTITSSNVTNAFGISGASQDRPQLASGCKVGQLATSGSVTSRLDNYFNAACITASPVITADGGTDFGNIGVGVVRGPAQNNFDIALVKRILLQRSSERINLDFRTEFFNAFNTPQFSNPADLNAGIIFSGAFIPNSASFGKITSTSVNPRIIQFALKLNF
jgi:hypothetical protein